VFFSRNTHTHNQGITTSFAQKYFFGDQPDYILLVPLQLPFLIIQSTIYTESSGTPAMQLTPII
jgi:hypothetical protein